MTFRGSLAEVSLADILQLVAVSSRTGILSLRRGEERGEIHIDKGQISHAATGLLSGDAAFYELARWNSGEFEFAQDVPLGPRTVDKSNPALLEEAIRQAGEWRILATKIHSTRMVPVFSPQAASGVSLAAHEWAIVSRVDERRNLEEIAAALGQSTFEVCKVVYTLLSTGVLALREDLRQLPLERLRRLTAEELGRLAERVHRTALELAPGRETQLNLDGAVRLFRAEHESGRALDALIDLVRDAEKAINSVLGPEPARTFIDRVALQLNGGETDRAAGRRAEPAARVERRVVDLGAARLRLSELVYRGLGPKGETHVLKIEKTKTIEDLIKVGSACRDFLLKLGQQDLADQVTAELENLE